MRKRGGVDVKMLDEKGRLWGKVNVADFLIIILILAAMPAFLHVYNALGKRPVRIPYERVRVEAVTFTSPEIAQLIKEDDASYDEYGNKDARLLKIFRKGDRYGEELKSAMAEGRRGLDSGRKVLLFLELELLCTRASKNQPYYFRMQSIFAGLNRECGFIFRTDKYSAYCYIIRINSQMDPCRG